MRLNPAQLICAALLLSLLLHAVLLALPRLQGAASPTILRRQFQLVKLWHQPAPRPPRPIPPQVPPVIMQKALPAHQTSRDHKPGSPPRAAIVNPASPAITSEKLQAPAEAPTAVPAAAPAINFTESARAAAGAAARAAQSDAWQQNSVLRPKEAHRNLKKPEGELTTALGRDFEKRFGEEVVLSVEEHQEGMERMTIVRTNKGMRCGYTRLVNPQYMGNFPIITRWGDCAKTQ